MARASKAVRVEQNSELRDVIYHQITWGEHSVSQMCTAVLNYTGCPMWFTKLSRKARWHRVNFVMGKMAKDGVISSYRGTGPSGLAAIMFSTWSESPWPRQDPSEKEAQAVLTRSSSHLRVVAGKVESMLMESIRTEGQRISAANSSMASVRKALKVIQAHLDVIDCVRQHEGGGKNEQKQK